MAIALLDLCPREAIRDRQLVCLLVVRSPLLREFTVSTRTIDESI